MLWSWNRRKWPSSKVAISSGLNLEAQKYWGPWDNASVPVDTRPMASKSNYWKPEGERHIIHLISSNLSLNRVGRWGTTDDLTISFLHFSRFTTALWDLANSKPVHSLMLPSHLFVCLPCLLPPFTVHCKMVLARPDEWETWPYHCSLCLFMMVMRSLCAPIACWILAWTSSLVTWSSYSSTSFPWLVFFFGALLYKTHYSSKRELSVIYLRP